MVSHNYSLSSVSLKGNIPLINKKNTFSFSHNFKILNNFFNLLGNLGESDGIQLFEDLNLE